MVYARSKQLLDNLLVALSLIRNFTVLNYANYCRDQGKYWIGPWTEIGTCYIEVRTDISDVLARSTPKRKSYRLIRIPFKSWRIKSTELP